MKRILAGEAVTPSRICPPRALEALQREMSPTPPDERLYDMES